MFSYGWVMEAPWPFTKTRNEKFADNIPPKLHSKTGGKIWIQNPHVWMRNVISETHLVLRLALLILFLFFSCIAILIVFVVTGLARSEQLERGIFHSIPGIFSQEHQQVKFSKAVDFIVWCVSVATRALSRKACNIDTVGPVGYRPSDAGRQIVEGWKAESFSRIHNSFTNKHHRKWRISSSVRVVLHRKCRCRLLRCHTVLCLYVKSEELEHKRSSLLLSHSLSFRLSSRFSLYAFGRDSYLKWCQQTGIVIPGSDEVGHVHLQQPLRQVLLRFAIPRRKEGLPPSIQPSYAGAYTSCHVW